MEMGHIRKEEVIEFNDGGRLLLYGDNCMQAIGKTAHEYFFKLKKVPDNKLRKAFMLFKAGSLIL